MIKDIVVPVLLLCLSLVGVALVGLKVDQAARRRGSPPLLRAAQVVTVVTFLLFFVLYAIPEIGPADLLPTLVGVALVLADLGLFMIAAGVAIALGRKYEDNDPAKT